MCPQVKSLCLGRRSWRRHGAPAPPLPCDCDYHCPGHPLTLQPRHSPRALAHISLGVVTVPCPGTARVSHSFSSSSGCGPLNGSYWGGWSPFPMEDQRKRSMFRGNELVPCWAQTCMQISYSQDLFFFLMALVFPDHVVSDLGLRLEHVFSVNLPCWF